MLTRRHHHRSRAVDTFVYTLFIIFCMSGCSPRIVERVVVQRDTLQVHHRDTTYRRDSIYIREWMKGDTVYVDRYRDRYVFRDRWRDSISVREVHDTTAVEVKVEKELNWAQRAKIKSFPWILLSLIGLLVWTFRKFLF